jgi:hypothetical protein
VSSLFLIFTLSKYSNKQPTCQYKISKTTHILTFFAFFNLLSHCFVFCYYLMAKHLYMLFLYPFHEIQSLNFSPRVFFLFQIPIWRRAGSRRWGPSIPGCAASLLLAPSNQSRSASALADPIRKNSELLVRSDPELLVLVGSGIPCTIRSRNSLYWSDLELLVLVGSGTP